MIKLYIPVVRLPHAEDLPLPAYATEQAAGLDLTAAISKPITLAPMARQLVPTGICLALPEGFEGQIRPRSGLALKHGLTILNTPGTIDADYRGEVGLLVVNLGAEAFEITRGLRLAQMVFTSHARATLQAVHTLPATVRGAGGFGSTGTKTEP